MSAALSLWKLLEDMDAAGLTLPHGTGIVQMDSRCAAWVARNRLYLPADFVWAVFEGEPVRRARAIALWAGQDPDLQEQIKTLTNWGRRYGHRVPDRVVRGAVATVRGQQRDARGQHRGAWGGQDEAERERITRGLGAA